MMKILVITKGNGGVPYFRSTNPHINLQKHYANEVAVTIKQDGNLTIADFEGFDIVHFNRDLLNFTFENFTTLVNHLRKKGTKIILDIDDHYILPSTHPMYYGAKHSKLKEKIIHNIRLVDVVTTTTPYFKKTLLHLNKNVHIIPNAIDPSEPQFKDKHNESNRVRFGYIAGSSHKNDISFIRPLSIAAKQNGSQLVFCGFDIRGTKTEYDKEGKATSRNFRPEETISYHYEKILTSNYNLVSEAHKKHLHNFSPNIQYSNIDDEKEYYRREWTKPIKQYATHYNNIDVSLAPLQNIEFNRVKSQLKVIESGFFKKPIIASNIEPYQIDVVDGVNGFLIDYKKPKLWSKAMKKLMDKDVREEMGLNLYNSVKDKYDLNKLSIFRFNLYSEL